MQTNGQVKSDAEKARQLLLQKYLRGGAARGETSVIVKRTSSAPAPLSHSQQQIWLHSQLAGDWPIYNEPITIHRRGELDVAALERSFTEIVRRHEAWRTTFAWSGNEARQIVQPAPERIAIPFLDLRSHSQPEAEALRLATEDAREPFNLTRGPLYRLRLLRLHDDEHRLFLTLHHIIFDGVSLYRILLPELLSFYESFARNEKRALPEPAIQYPDYAIWHRQISISPEHFTYWQNTLRHAPVLDLPIDKPRPRTQSYAGAMELFAVPTATATALKALSQQQAATPFLTMTAAFVALLHGYTGDEDIVTGTVSSGRQRPEVSDLLGCFLNTIPLRCLFSKRDSFEELLRRVRSATLSALAHEVPFELLVQKFGQNRDPGRAPLFQTLIVMEPPLDPLPEGWSFTHTDVDAGTAKFDLQLDLDDRVEGLTGRFVYNSDLFERKTIELLKSRWLDLLGRIASSPRERLENLTAWSSVVARTLPPPEWEGPRSDYPRDKSIHQIFEEQAQLTPAAVAVVFGNAQLSYDELNRRANRLARHLRKLGVRPDVPVGLWMERSADMIVALLAILKAGGAYVPLDPSYPAKRLRWMISDTLFPSSRAQPVRLTPFAQGKLREVEGSRCTQAAVILSQESLHARVEANANGTQIVFAEAFPNEDDSNLEVDVGGENLAYIIYTSGSTGQPKGVTVPHRAVVRLVKATDYVSFSANETFLQLAPISFDASTFEIWGALLNGGKIAVLPTVSPTLEEIGRAISAQGVTTLWLTSALFNAMVDERLEDLRPLRQLLAGGDVLSVAHVRKVLAALPNTRLINGYGPTESTTFACCHTIESVPSDNRSIPIGKPIANTTAYILDETLHRVPISEVGELYLGGDGLARGYWNREDLTAEKFVRDPFGARSNGRLYATGDLARWRQDGAIEFLGREDSQIKLRGFRIEPGEIENALKKQPDVRDGVVVVRENVPGQKRLHAYVAGSAAPQTLLAALRKSLPDYMVPSTITTLDSLPRTSNGKIDRNALPAPPVSAKDESFIAPKTPLEKTIASVWAAVLGLDRVSRSDNFFELGGHSLAGLRVVNQLSELLRQRLQPSVFLSAPTVAAMAELLESKRERKTTYPAANVRPYMGLQLELIPIWEELLGVRPIHIRDNFFELGGNSRLALQMLQRTEAVCGKAISAIAFSTNPTVEHLARELARQVMEESSSLITINDTGTRTPFFYLHGDLFGGGFYSSKLARALGPDQPFYVLPPIDVRRLAVAPTIEQMASAHLEAIRAVRPRGPYVVGGFCLGGIVAYELAQQIVASGDEVKMLLLIDVAPEDKTLRRLRRLSEKLAQTLSWDERERLHRFGRWVIRRTQFALWRDEILREQARLALRHMSNRVAATWKKLRGNRDVQVADSSGNSERDVPSAFLWAAAGYRARPYGASLALFLSEDLLQRGHHLARDWEQLAPALTVQQLKGSHLECITAHVDDLVGNIEQCLQRISTKAAAPAEQS